jgi:hypothetical protein
MARISRPSIVIDIKQTTIIIDASLTTVMALLAQRLQRTKQEFVPVTTMRFDMVCDGGWRSDPTREAHCA